MAPELLDRKVIAEFLTRDAAWAWSHGAEGEYLGSGLLYYAITYALKARTAVCLGSGGGFVPRLIRQAQRDLGMADAARTVLVDGNRPEAGWGSPEWLDEGSFFRKNYPDVEVLLDLAVNAARDYFAPRGVTIDYLHIDADHSFRGCLEDFEAYRPFLREGSVVTLHDTDLPGAGVRDVIEHVRTLPDCEVLDLPDWGEGVAVVRVTDPPAARLGPAGAAGSVRLTRRPGARPADPPGRGWKYLESPAFATRYVLAAHFTAPCRCVIEVGGGKTPIDHFLTGTPESVIVLDPFLREYRSETLNGRACQVSHVRARFQDVEWEVPEGADYGLVLLGLEIQGMEPEHYEALFRLVNRARVTVIEFPTSWPPSREQFERIRDNTATREAYVARLDLQGNDFGDLSGSWPPRCDREIHVLQPR